jgi:hypothetical protein
MASTQQDRISVPTPVRVFTGPTTTCQLFTSDAYDYVEIFGAGSVANVPITCILPPFGGPYTIFDGAGIASTYPITVQNSAGVAVGIIGVNGGSLAFAWNGTAMAIVDRSNQVITVEQFGAVGDGVTDDTAAIQAAINALPLTGGEVLFEAKSYLISASITLGNGTIAAASTRNSVVLRGASTTFSNIQPRATGGGTQIIWKPSAGAGKMIFVQGAMQGWGVKNMYLNGNSVAQAGIFNLAGCFGDVENVSIENCGDAISFACPATGVSNNAMSNRVHNLFIILPAIPNAVGISLDGAFNNGNSTFNDFENVVIFLNPAVQCFGIYLKLCDTNSFRNVLITNGGASAVSIAFDYTTASAQNFPSGNSFFSIDPAGIAVGQTVFYENFGTPAVSARPNYIYGLGQANGAANPNLVNFTASLPTREWFFSVTTQHSAIGAFAIMTPNVGGMFRINSVLLMTGSGTGGTIAPAFGAIGNSIVQSIQQGSVNATGGSTNESFIIWQDGAQPINGQVNFSGVTGTPTYNWYVAIERLD